MKKAGCFQAITAFFLYKYKFFFSKKPHFLRGKVPFIFDQDRFIEDHCTSLQSTIGTVLNPCELSAIARETGFLQRQSKFKPEDFIDILVFSSFDHSQLSLQECCDDLAQHRHKSLSKEGLHKRFNKQSVAFVKAVFAKQVALKVDSISPLSNWGSFSKVVIGDSVKFTLPEEYHKEYPGYSSFGNKKPSAMMNIQYSFDLKHGHWENLEFTKATQNDQGHSNKTVERIKKNELHIRDLGFVTMTYLAGVVKQEAFFLNRLPPQWKPVKKSNGKTIDWKELYKKMRESGTASFEAMVTVSSRKESIDCRLIAMPVPEEVWSERIRKAQQKMESMGRSLSDEYKARCRFNVFITNAEANILNAEAVTQLYRLRWQIELIFKSWKSLLGIHKVKSVKIERFECQLVARFIWILLNWKMFQCFDVFIRNYSSDYACSVWKFFKQARLFGYALRKATSGQTTIRALCELFIFPIIKSLLIEPKKNKKAGYLITNGIFNPLG